MSYFGVIEDAFSSLLAKSVTAKFKLDAFLRGDTLTRYNAYSQALSSGWLTTDEVRELEGLEPLAMENTDNAIRKA
jgi:phage portal protein BeeE